jgi:hypothetical protein
MSRRKGPPRLRDDRGLLVVTCVAAALLLAMVVLMSS